jgi:thiol-disulfide isomerase/thioredoxin
VQAEPRAVDDGHSKQGWPEDGSLTGQHSADFEQRGSINDRRTAPATMPLVRSKDPLVIFLLLILSLAIAPAHGATPEERPFTWHEFEEDGSVRVNLYVFWSESCPHCHRALRFLGALEKELRWLEVQPLEVSSPEDVEAYSALAKKLGTDARYVPAFFYSGRAFQGYHDDYTTGPVPARESGSVPLLRSTIR